MPAGARSCGAIRVMAAAGSKRCPAPFMQRYYPVADWRPVRFGGESFPGRSLGAAQGFWCWRRSADRQRSSVNRRGPVGKSRFSIMDCACRAPSASTPARRLALVACTPGISRAGNPLPAWHHLRPALHVGMVRGNVRWKRSPGGPRRICAAMRKKRWTGPSRPVYDVLYVKGRRASRHSQSFFHRLWGSGFSSRCSLEDTSGPNRKAGMIRVEHAERCVNGGRRQADAVALAPLLSCFIPLDDQLLIAATARLRLPRSTCTVCPEGTRLGTCQAHINPAILVENVIGT